MMRLREAGLFLLCSILICLAVFRGALWGSRILAPLDIAPMIFSKYSYVNPSAGKIPANHYIIDQLTFDLPLQYTLYHSYRHGEIPWWDPYTYAGRPLLADAHVNGTDPIRLICYLTLPFVGAYNWNLILKSILTGLGMFLLLRHLRFALSISLPLALTYQFAGCFAIFFGHPWIQASFAYYPILWMVWAAALERPAWRLNGVAALLCALIFYSGNLQSHAYLLVFGLGFFIGYGFLNRSVALRTFRLVAFSGLIGAALAAPVVWPQIEFYGNSLRTASSSPSSHWACLTGIASLSSAFPWVLGTFRTLDVSKLVGVNAAGFVVFIGSAAFFLAAIGLWKSDFESVEQRSARRAAAALVLLYFFVCSTPLLNVLYNRMAPIAVMGLTVLAAGGLHRIAVFDRPLSKLSWMIAGFVVVVMLSLNVAAFVIYPRYIERVRTLVVSRDQTNLSFDQTPALRAFQVDNLPREISMQNPETVLASLSLVVLALYLRRRQPVVVMQAALLTLNFIPVVLFFTRYAPNHPVSYWQHLLADGVEQNRVAALLNRGGLRLLENCPGVNEMLFPNNMAHLRRVHAVHGYSALQPASLFRWPFSEPPPQPIADFVYTSKERAESVGKLTQVTSKEKSRLRCEQRDVSITGETLNTLTVAIAPGPAAQLLRTDTFYPGWQARWNGQAIMLRQSGKLPFSTIDIPSSEKVGTITYTYRPSHFLTTISLATSAALLLFVSLFFAKSTSIQPTQSHIFYARSRRPLKAPQA